MWNLSPRGVERENETELVFEKKISANNFFKKNLWKFICESLSDANIPFNSMQEKYLKKNSTPITSKWTVENQRWRESFNSSWETKDILPSKNSKIDGWLFNKSKQR